MGEQGKMIAALPDIPQAKKDSENLHKCLRKYDIQKEEDVFILNDDPSEEKVRNVFFQMEERLSDGLQARPKINYLVLFLFAGHNVIVDGMQALLLNEFDHSRRCHKILHAEAIVREFSEKFMNSYIITIFENYSTLVDVQQILGKCISKQGSAVK